MMKIATTIRVETGPDDPDNLGQMGHFFPGHMGFQVKQKITGYPGFQKKWHQELDTCLLACLNIATKKFAVP